ncbi:hypothetical protein [Enterococcus faecalis]|uniref:hypothetical protein n=1 Tax=Enterococcus faecalis TaxID=1351 RepID=UPI0003544860|nr:hypothetical protein [Enterococcus faecalis]EGO6632985.1 hypothetical protein [Enterococcus faecalis]EPH69718.1 hypothetical protein D928_02356 [Enterococcus faecalis 20-SD-BW-06]EPI02227.1 hypothetical protein D919_00989 [Enterococcus faecalis 20-SD-BW-08]USG68625.1 hypothetical protein NDO76_06945 [Enterococcus faecalis]HAP3294181.1 hypothetical protein [Enterococcus faecalis]
MQMIRKTILASSILGVGLLIGACGNQTQTQMNSTNTSESSQPKVTESSRKSSESASNNEGVSSDSSKSTSSTTESEILKGLAEEKTLKEKIPSLKQTTIKQVTDNEYKRILVMEEKATGTTYKSILIKKQNRLKIVNETTDELLYNGTL